VSRLRVVVFVAFAVLAAALFSRLGIWQVHRLQERRARNALVISRLDSAQVDLAALPRDTALARFRRVRVVGTPDYDNELVLAARTHNGAPGVDLITPMRIAGSDTAVLLNRGWVYSPDAATLRESRWRENDTVVVGYAEILPPSGGASYASRPHTLTRLTYTSASAALPYPVLPFYVVVMGDTTTVAGRPQRVGVPPLDEGPHKSYAIQWFFFALVALVGAGIVVSKQRA
jgi:surfeit locus 1 family protein